MDVQTTERHGDSRAPNDPYTWWKRACLAVAEGKRAPATPLEPQPGFYQRALSRGGPMVPASIHIRCGQYHCVVGGEARDDVAQQWLWLSRRPIMEAQWREMIAARGPEEQSQATAAPAPQQIEEAPAALAPAPIGHNNPPTDAVEAIAQEIQQAVGAAAVDLKRLYGATPRDQAEADRLGDHGAALKGIAQRADKLRKELKEPHKRAAEEIDGRFRALTAPIAAVTNDLRQAVNDWLKAEQARLDVVVAEERARAQEEAERLAAIENEGRAAVAQTLGTPIEPVPPIPAKVKDMRARAGTGRAAHARTVIIAEITDWRAAVLDLESNPEVRELVQKIANKLAAVGAEKPWMKTVKSKRTVL